ncbi:MAG: DUF4403 family protein [Polyangiaceae bacterium]
MLNRAMFGRHRHTLIPWVAALACTPRGTEPGAGTTGRCAERVVAAAPGQPAAEAATPSSRLVVELRARASALSREIAKQVPRTLGSARQQPSGVVGNVSYVVTRGNIGVSLEGERLVATVPVAAEVEVCKPLGPICIRYGACSPRLSARAAIPLVLGEDYSLRPARASVALTKTCVIAGFDAAPEIRKMARQQIGAIEARINSSVPPLRGYVQGAWQLLQVPVALSRDTCLKAEPESLSQSLPRMTDGVLSMRLGATAKATFEDPCAERDAKEAASPLPPRRLDESLPAESELRVVLRSGWREVSASLSRSARQTRGDVQILRVVASSQQTTAGPRVRLDVTVDGSVCGEASYLAEPAFDEKARRIHMRKLTPLGEHPAALDAVRQALEGSGEVPIAVDTADASKGLAAAVDSAVADLPKDVKVELSLQPAKVVQVVADPRGILAVLAVRGEAVLRLD